MNAISGFCLKNPAHSSGFVKHEIIEPLGLSVTAVPEVLEATRAALLMLPNERAHLSPEMALRIDKAFDVSQYTPMRMQTSCDIAQAQGREGEIEIAPLKGKPLVPQPAMI